MNATADRPGVLVFAPLLYLGALLVGAVAVMHWGVVLREERHLHGKFGAPYDECRRRVRRYV